MRWVAPVCSDPSGSGDRPLDEYLLQRRQLAPDDWPGIPDDTVQTSVAVLGGGARPGWK